MPYINNYIRIRLDRGEQPSSAGELNYVILKLILDFLSSKEKIRYADLNEIMGVLESVKQEFYRRVVVPYEEKKIKENGDIPALEEL